LKRFSATILNRGERILNSEADKIPNETEEMPKKKKVKVKTYKRRAPGRVRRTVTVSGYSRSLPRKGVKKYTPSSRRTKRTTGTKKYTPRSKRRL